MSMTEFHRKVLDKVGPVLSNELDCDSILLYLLGDEAISRDDKELIDSKPTRKAKVYELLKILPKRGDGAYVSLQNALTQEEGLRHLYDEMKKHEEWVTSQLQLELEEEHAHKHDGIDSISMPNDVEMQEAAELDMHSTENIQTSTLVGLQPAGADDRGRQPRHPNKVLTDPDLLDLAQELGEHWEMLALKLGITKAVIYQCKENNKHNTQNQIFDMLYKWKCSHGKRATVSVLLAACKRIKQLGEDAYEFLYDL